jgi:hypothetical protein
MKKPSQLRDNITLVYTYTVYTKLSKSGGSRIPFVTKTDNSRAMG